MARKRGNRRAYDRGAWQNPCHAPRRYRASSAIRLSHLATRHAQSRAWRRTRAPLPGRHFPSRDCRPPIRRTSRRWISVEVGDDMALTGRSCRRCRPTGRRCTNRVDPDDRIGRCRCPMAISNRRCSAPPTSPRCWPGRAHAPGRFRPPDRAGNLHRHSQSRAAHRDGGRATLIGDCRGVSAVCTHPDVQGRGYARALIGRVVNRMLRAGQTPILHVDSRNTRAIDLYLALGFVRRAEYPLLHARRIG